MVSITDLLGSIGVVGLTLFYIPQLVTAWRSPKLQGFNLPSWCILWIAVIALMTQSILLEIWTAAIANVVGSLATGGIVLRIIKGER